MFLTASNYTLIEDICQYALLAGDRRELSSDLMMDSLPEVYETAHRHEKVLDIIDFCSRPRDTRKHYFILLRHLIWHTDRILDSYAQ